MLTTTLNAIKSKSPCRSGWKKLLKHLGKFKADDEPLGFDVILKSNGLDDAFWAMRVLDGAPLKQAKLFICDIAERALKYVPERDDRPAQTIAMSRKFINGDCSIEELREARQAAAAYDYAAPANAAAYAANASYAAPAYAADAAAYTAYAANASRKQERQEQEKMFIEFISKF